MGTEVVQSHQHGGGAADGFPDSFALECFELGRLSAAARLRLDPSGPEAYRTSFAAYRGPKSPRPYFERKWLSLRLSAVKRGMVVDASVTPAFLQGICVSECPVTREPVDVDGPTEQRPTLDRLVNEVGYRAGNICMLSRRANHAKAEFSFEEVLQIAVKAEPFRGLDAKEWARLASLMYGAWAHAYKKADPYLIPLSAIPGEGMFMSTSQVVQLLLLRHFGAGGPRKKATTTWLRMTRASGATDGLFLCLRDALTAALKDSAQPADAWTQSKVFDAFVHWYRICQLEVVPELEALLAMHQEKLGDESASADWERNVRRKAAAPH